jgi:hypothetical protein
MATTNDIMPALSSQAERSMFASDLRKKATTEGCYRIAMVMPAAPSVRAEASAISNSHRG